MLAACGAEGGGTREIRRDSAGVQIVQNPPPDSGADRWWTLASEPQLDVGTVEGAESQVLFGVIDAVRLEDGRVVIAIAGNAQVRYYAPGGAHLVTSGGRGGGPGEFQRITGLLRMSADSVAVLDGGVRRVTVLAPDGRFSRVVLAAPGAPVTVLGRRDDGTWVAHSNSLPRSNAVQQGPLRSNVVYVALPPGGGEVIDTLGQFPGPERVVRIAESGGTITSINILTAPFAKTTTVVTAGNDLVVGTQDAAEVRIYNGEGDLRRIVRTGLPTQRVTPELIDAYMKRRLDRVPAERQQAMRESQLAILTAEVVPPYGALALDRSGNLWLQDFPGLADDQRWTIFDAGGARVARMVLPRQFTPYDIGDDWILGRELDELDVEHVRLYAIHRSNE
ncbi:MAG: hypothetical protein WEE89_21915 [Gemmatimonadota bacterium]